MSPVTPSQFCESIPANNSDLCTKVSKFFGIAQLLCDFFSFLLKSDGTLSDDFKTELASFITPTGVVVYSASINMGDGWLICNGQAVSRTTYAALFSAIGTRYGAGDSSTTFNLPNLQGRSPIGAGSGSGLTFRDINNPEVGEEKHIQTEAELAPHTHAWHSPQTRTEELGGGANNAWAKSSAVKEETESTGGGVGFNVVHPCVVLYPFVKT